MSPRLEVVAMLGALVLAGCSSATPPSVSPAFTRQAECERNRGWWRAEMSFCEYRAPPGDPAPAPDQVARRPTWAAVARPLC